MKKNLYNVTILKALSLIAVSIYHLLSHRLSGGFLGVIIFMIISGFFLERASVNSSGEVDTRIYIKKIKARILKIMSPLWTIVAISLLFALVFSREIFDDSIQSSLSTIFAVENIRAIVKGISYFDRSGNFNLFTHLWYISVYIQVVIIYYLIDYLINKFDLKDKRLTIFAAGTLISTMISYYLSFTKAPVIRIYYGTDTRISAFFIGVCANILYRENKARIKGIDHKKLARILLIPIVLPFFFINGKSLWIYRTFFLAYELIVALFLLLIYDMEIKNHIAYRKQRPFFKFMIWLGDRSYYYYLWQYIVQVFFTYFLRTKIENRFLFYFLELIVLVIFAEFSYQVRFANKKFRSKKLIGSLIIIIILNIISLAIGNKKQEEMDKFKKNFSQNQEEIKKRNEDAKKIKSKASSGKNTSKEKENLNFKEKAYDDFNFTDKELSFLKRISITAVGDSVLMNVDSYLRDYVPNLYLDGEVGSDMPEGPDRLMAIKNDIGLNDIILVGLGSNGSANDSDMEAIMDIADGRDVYFVNTSHLESYMDQVNKNIKAFTDSHDKAHLVDWRSFVKDRDDLLAVDRVHPNVEGSTDYAELILRKILNVNKVES